MDWLKSNCRSGSATVAQKGCLVAGRRFGGLARVENQLGGTALGGIAVVFGDVTELHGGQ
ncbi:MAG TPA: hypothetical protein VGE35_02060 [Candidatus Paceibacterota bacterium]